MGLARSTYYDEPEIQPIDEARLVEQIKEVCAEWPAYGYRRVTAELHGEGHIVNHKKVMRLMKENRLSVRPRRRFIATTDSDHDGPVFPNLAKNIVPGALVAFRARFHEALVSGLPSGAARPLGWTWFGLA
jgi:putative transposase